MDVQSVNLNLLVALDAILEERSVTRAARRVGVSQPAMSYSLAQLRGLFDDALVLRGGLLTPRAESLRPGLRAGLDELRRVLDPRDRFEPSTTRRTFRIAASDTFQVVALHRLVSDVAARAPRVDVIVRGAAEGTWTALASGTVDLLAGSDEQQPDPGAESLDLYPERFVCIVRRGHPSVGARLGIATYCRLPHVLVSSDEEPGLVDRALAREGRSRRVAVRLPDFAGIGHLIAGTDMIATVPERLALRLAESLPLRVAPPPMALPTFPVRLYWHPRFAAEPGHRWLRERLVAVVREP